MRKRGQSVLRAVCPSAGRPAAEHFVHVNVRRLLGAGAGPAVARRAAAACCLRCAAASCLRH